MKKIHGFYIKDHPNGALVHRANGSARPASHIELELWNELQRLGAAQVNIETEMTTEELLAQRHQVYGDRVENMERVAQMWSGYLGFEVRPVDVPAMLALYKLYRLNVEPEYSDNIDDVDGYMQMTREVIGDRLIKARTVDEFIQKRAARQLAEEAPIVESTSVAVTTPGVAGTRRVTVEAQEVRQETERRLAGDETEEERAERQHEERAYGQSMGRGE